MTIIIVNIKSDSTDTNKQINKQTNYTLNTHTLSLCLHEFYTRGMGQTHSLLTTYRGS